MSEHKQILFLASESGDGQFRHLIDPALARRLAACGMEVHGAFFRQVTPEVLAASDAVVLMRTPQRGHAKDDSEVWAGLMPQLYDFVRAGGGLGLMFSESYGRSEASLNEFAAPLGIRFYFNEIIESNPARCGMVPNLDGGRTVLAEVVAGVLPTLTIPAVEVVVSGGHGTEQLTCDADATWQPLLRAQGSCVSRAFPDGLYSNGSPVPITAPVWAAVRDYGRGRIGAFPGSAPLWIASVGIPRFGAYLLDQQNGAGWEWLRCWLEWLASGETGDGNAAVWLKLEEERQRARSFSFRYITSEEQQSLRTAADLRLWIGTIPAGMTVDELVADGQNSGCGAMVILEDYHSFTPELWKERRREYRRFLPVEVTPGFELADEEGNLCAVFNVIDFPEMRVRYPNSNMLEDLLVKVSAYTAICATPARNRYPVWRQGGYNFLEYSEGEAAALYDEKVAGCSPIGALTIARGTLPSTEIICNRLLLPGKMSWQYAVTENQHYAYPSSGPRIECFGLFGPKLMLDDWEGCWYEWDEGETATLEIALRANAAFEEVTVWNGTECFRRYTPGVATWHHTETLTLTEDLHLTLRARCTDGTRIYTSFPLHTRNRHFWGHVGGDQMNDYHNVFQESPEGFLGIGDRFYEPYGFVTCGISWGDYVRISSPVPWSDLMPSGIEVSTMTANFKSFHPSVWVKLPEGGFDFLNHHHRRLGRCTAHEHFVHSHANAAWIEQPDAIWIHPDTHRKYHPTRAIVPSTLWETESVYTIPRWEPYSPTRIDFATILRWKRDFKLTAGTKIVLAQSLHTWKAGLKIRTEAGETALEQLLSPKPLSPEAVKEWDVMGIGEALLHESAAQSAIDITDGMTLCGDPAGEYAWENTGIGGQITVRGWRWRGDGFVLVYEWEPETRRFAAGTEVPLHYAITLDARK